MLNNQDYISAFLKIQDVCFDVTKTVAAAARSGMSERDISDMYHAELARKGYTELWYPTLVCAGQYTGQPLTRRNHLPESTVKVRENDILTLDITPIDKDHKTVWGNWSIVKSIGDDPFYKKLGLDILSVTLATAAEALASNPVSLGRLHESCVKLAKASGLENIDSRGNIGHSIFQVPEGQTVDKTPDEDRIFIDATDHPVPKACLLSIEPEFGCVNPADGVRYGGKFQFIVPIGYGEQGKLLIKSQYDFYHEMALAENDSDMLDSLKAIDRFLPNEGAARPNLVQRQQSDDVRPTKL